MRSAVHSTDLFGTTEVALRSELSHLPVLTVFGERNDPIGFADRWKAMFPTATACAVGDGNHFPMCDHSAGYADRLAGWHRSHGLQ